MTWKTCYILFFLVLGVNSLVAQKILVEGDKISMPAAAIYLNKKTKNILIPASSGLTVIDFFGTWCVPCVRALPNLQKLQAQESANITVVLISTETSEKLQAFIDKHQPFDFPVIVDTDKKVSNLFNPPSLPYTIIIDSTGRIIEITSAEELTSQKLENLRGRAFAVESNTITLDSMQTNRGKPSIPAVTDRKDSEESVLVDISSAFIYAAKTGEDITALLNKLKEIPFSTLQNELATDDEKKAFWINIYNGFTHHILSGNPGAYKNRNSFFKKRQFPIAGKLFSLDEIEHGILRRSKTKWSLGYINKFFPGKREKALRVGSLDNRIHFALNCGARSCPPIAFYKATDINRQLDVAAKSYLGAETVYDAGSGTIALPAIMGWFRADFSGKKGMIRLLRRYDIIPAVANPHISFRKYDWNLFLNNYTSNHE